MPRAWAGILAAVVLAAAAWAAGAPPSPSRGERCPVCGMFVAPFPQWRAAVVFADGTVRYFDGPKDLFRYRVNPGRYDPGRTDDDVTAWYVTEYYSARLVRAEELFYVVGSDVLGPMGHELVPVDGEDRAEAFRRDHGGRGIYRFSEITAEVLSEVR